VTTLRGVQTWSRGGVPRLPGRGPALRVFDTSTEQLRPLAQGRTARIYVCGITPYDATHLGHAATYVAFDQLSRVLLDAGTEVITAQNVTDIDDPLLERATATGEDWRALAARETALFGTDMTDLRVLPPRHYVGAVEAIPTIVDTIDTLLRAGAAYALDGDVYFPVSAAPRFGEVAHLSRAQMRELFAERGGDPDRAGKRDPLDPLLWRSARPGEPSWPSPLGAGRPGWHVECASIALATLGPTIDVQGGGVDLAFPHHEMSAAHACAASGHWPFARAYVHTGMVGLDGKKMSKSLGNLVLVSQVRAAGVDLGALRLALLAHHYRGDWSWVPEDLQTATHRLGRWREAFALPSGPPAEPLVTALRGHLTDDLDTPHALDDVDRWAREALTRRGKDPEAPGRARTAVDALLGVLA
jgi:L-cysteine:1D-myo-inositol 2-amino-2-deoxy-alpha-D-glucopyranoside ligase